MKKYSLITILITVTLTTSFSAHAYNSDRNANFFLTLGRTFIEAEGEKEDASALKIGGGYRFFDYAGFEAYYIYYGKITERVDVGISNTFKANAFVFNGIAFLPVTPQFDLYAKVGISKWDAELKFLNIVLEADGSDPIYTLGFGYNIDYDSTIRLEYEHADYDEIKFSVISFGFQHNF